MTRLYSSISVETILSSGVTSSQTTMVVATGTGTTLLGGVTLASGNVDQFTVVLDPDTVNEEIIFVTGVSGDTFTIVRGRAGSTAITHASGATVRHVLTSDDLNFFKTAIQPSTATAKGDLLAATGSGVVTRLAVGTNTQVLTADSTQATGIKWATPTSGYTQPTIGSTAIPSGTTVTTIAGLTLTSPTISGSPSISGATLTTSTLTSPTINDPKLNLSVNAQTGTTYTFVLTDNGKLVTASNAAAQTYSIPTNASVAFPVGTQINLIQIGAGQVTVQAVTSGTTTVLSAGATAAAPKARVQYSALTCIKVATDTWYVIGDIA